MLIKWQSEFDKSYQMSYYSETRYKWQPEPDNNNKTCFFCNNERIWCARCVPSRIKDWTSGNLGVDKFIKETIYNAKYYNYPIFLEWVPFDRFKDIKQIGEGGYSKVYSATWIDGNAKYTKQNDGTWKLLEPKPMKVALKRLNGSQNMSAKYFNELKTYWNFYKKSVDTSLKFYGLTKDPETQEFAMIMEFADHGNLRGYLSKNFNYILWHSKIRWLYYMARSLRDLHELECSHKDFHSGNILQMGDDTYLSDFGLSGPPNEQESNDKIYGVLPYIAPEVLKGDPYTLSSDIYSFGVVMAELSSGKPPFYKRKHDDNLTLAICNGLRPGFGRGTPGIYKNQALRCMDADPKQRPSANELCGIFKFWYMSFDGYYSNKEKFGYEGREVKVMFEEADKEIPNISTSYEKDPDAIYTSKAFTTSYHHDSQISNLKVPSNSLR